MTCCVDLLDANAVLKVGANTLIAVLLYQGSICFE